MIRTPRWREVVPPLVLAVALAAVGSFAYFTRHPESPALASVVDWPVLGPVAERFRAAYLPPAAVLPPMTDLPRDDRLPRLREAAPPRGDSAEGGAVEDTAAALPQIWVAAGTPVFSAPRPTALRRGEVPVVANLAFYDRQGDWFRVLRRDLEGWVHLPGYDARDAPLGRDPEPVLPLAPRPPDAAALAAARSHLDDPAAVEPLGPYTLYTDVVDRLLLARLDRLATDLETHYRQRYGLRPQGEPQAAIILYREESSYRRLQDSSAQIAGLSASGHSSQGMALLFRGLRRDDEVAGTLTHELVHLINRRALGPALPSWIDEGLCDDLALSAVADDGTLEPSRLSGTGVREENGRVLFHGGKAALFTLRDGLLDGTVPSVPQLLSLDWDGFVRSENSRLHYAAAAFFVRWLLEAEGSRRADSLRTFLASVALGGPATPEALRGHLGQPWPVIDALFRQWTQSHAETILAEYGTRSYRVRFVDEPP